MNQFTERYKTLSNSELLKIIDNPNDYQPLAVETAEAELAGRQLSDEELESAKAEIDLELQEKAVKKEKMQAFENKVKDVGTSLIDAVHPIQQSTPSTSRIINFLSAALAIMFLLTLFKEFGMITFMLFDKTSRWDATMLWYFVQLIFVPVLTLLFWLRKKAGWILLWIYCCVSIVNGLALLFFTLKHPYLFSTTDGFFPTISEASFLWTIIFFGGCLWFIGKQYVREVYRINNRTMLLISGITAAVTLGILWSSLSAR